MSRGWTRPCLSEQQQYWIHKHQPKQEQIYHELISSEGVRKDSTAYRKSKYTQAQEQYSPRQQLEFPLEQVDGLLPFKKVKPSETTKKKITNVHGSLKRTEVRKLIEQKEEDERKKEEKKKKRRKEGKDENAVSKLPREMFM